MELLRMEGIHKSFSGVPVLKGVHLAVESGMALGLLGENGAGKSTLMKILTGVYSLEKGTVIWKGEETEFRDVQASQSAGIAFIHQELNLVRDLTVAENIFLGREPSRRGNVQRKKMNEEARHWMAQLGLTMSPDTILKKLSVGQQQLVEIAKALSMDAKLIILDEPTGALTTQETDALFAVLQRLKSEGKALIYISHRLEEVFTICERVTILRDGEFIATYDVDLLDMDTLVTAMVGRALEDQYPYIPVEPGEEILSLEGVTNSHIQDVTFSLRAGEIVGVAGLMGAGRTEMARTIYGLFHHTGSVRLEGKEVRFRHPKDAMAHGIAYVSEDRKQNGLHVGMSLRDNNTMNVLPTYRGFLGMLQHGKETKSAKEAIEQFSIRARGPHQSVKSLSGGNQQKVALSKNIHLNPKVLILDEPTRGVDVGAKKEIYEIMNRLKQEGMAILMISSEIPEILGMSDRVLVMHEGRLQGELPRETASQESILKLALGQEGV